MILSALPDPREARRVKLTLNLAAAIKAGHGATARYLQKQLDALKGGAPLPSEVKPPPPIQAPPITALAPIPTGIPTPPMPLVEPRTAGFGNIPMPLLLLGGAAFLLMYLTRGKMGA